MLKYSELTSTPLPFYANVKQIVCVCLCVCVFSVRLCIIKMALFYGENQFYTAESSGGCIERFNHSSFSKITLPAEAHVLNEQFDH